MPLSDSDKEWIQQVAVLLEERLQDRIRELDERLQSRMRDLEGRLENRIGHLASREDVEDSETKLLREFQKWASPADMRTRANTLRTSALEQELQSFKDRLDKLEGLQ